MQAKVKIPTSPQAGEMRHPPHDDFTLGFSRFGQVLLSFLFMLPRPQSASAACGLVVVRFRQEVVIAITAPRHRGDQNC